MSHSSLTARWIAPPGENRDNHTFLARKKFALDLLDVDLILVAPDSPGSGQARRLVRETDLHRVRCEPRASAMAKLPRFFGDKRPTRSPFVEVSCEGDATKPFGASCRVR